MTLRKAFKTLCHSLGISCRCDYLTGGWEINEFNFINGGNENLKPVQIRKYFDDKQKQEEKFNALLDYLGLEFKEEHNIICKKNKK